jgi:hypothetical protein
MYSFAGGEIDLRVHRLAQIEHIPRRDGGNYGKEKGS